MYVQYKRCEIRSGSRAKFDEKYEQQKARTDGLPNWLRDMTCEGDRRSQACERDQMGRADRQPWEWAAVDRQAVWEKVRVPKPSDCLTNLVFAGGSDESIFAPSKIVIGAEIEINAVTTETQQAVEKFVWKNGLGEKVANKLRDASEAVASKVVALELSSRVRNTSAYVARVVAAESRSEAEQ